MGTIADLYDHMGGKVVILGKPSKEIYLKSCKQLDQIDKSKTIAGDSLDDIWVLQILVLIVF